MYFGRVELGVVAVEVEALGVHAPAHLLRAVLVDAVVGREVGQPVRTQHGDEKEREVLQQVVCVVAHEHVADEHEHGVFAIRLARMDAGLHEDDVFPASVDLFRVGGAVFVDDEQGHLAALGGRPNALVMYLLELFVEALRVGDSRSVIICLQVV